MTPTRTPDSPAVPAVHRGVLNLDLIIFIAIVAAITIYIFINGSSLFGTNTTNSEISNAQEIMTNTQSLLKTQGIYDFTDDAAMTGTLIEYNGTPPSMTIIGDKSSGSATLINGWNGAVTVAPYAGTGGSNTGFTLTYEQVPQSACDTMASQMSQSNVVAQTSINGTSTVGVINAQTAGEQCTADNGSEGTNTLIFTSLN